MTENKVATNDKENPKEEFNLKDIPELSDVV